MFKTNFGVSDFEYKIWEVNITNNCNPNVLVPKEIGGFNFSAEDKILRWLVYGDTTYDVTVPGDAEIIDCERPSALHGVFRSDKIIITNTRVVTDDMVMDSYYKLNLSKKFYFKAMAECAVRVYMKTAIKIFEDKVNLDNIDLVFSEFNYLGL